MIAKTPKPPYYAVIFTSLRTDRDHGYEEMAEKMAQLSAKQDGFLGMESARENVGITICYWRDLESIQQWKENEEHAIAQKKGKEEWYASYSIRIAKVEKAYHIDAIKRGEPERL